MSAHPGNDIGGKFRLSAYVLVPAVVYVALWVITAVAPRDRFAWLLENLPVLGLIAVLVATYRTAPLSAFSYVLILAFLSLHALGAHYTYSEMPLGLIAQKALGTDRNHYDRLVHFSFGLLFAYPTHELVTRMIRRADAAAAVIAVGVILALSSGYELIEWCVALLASPDSAFAFLGTQGDMFDSQKDTALALAGATLGQIAIALRSIWQRVTRA